MATTEIIKIVVGVIAALGGGGAIVLGLSTYLGQLLAKRYEERIKAKFQNEINEYQSQLDILKQTTLRYLDKQAELYNKLWASLYDLKLLADNLWREATPKMLVKFSKQLRLTKIEIDKASLFIVERHYNELNEVIGHFSQYQIGKSALIDYRQTGSYDEQQVRIMIVDNGNIKIQFEDLISAIRADLKRQMGGD